MTEQRRYSLMKKAIVALLSVVVLIVALEYFQIPIGVGVHVDSTVDFRIVGTIVDAGSKKTIEGAEVLFVDKGFDRERSEQPAFGTLILGHSGKKGSIDLSPSYFWGRNEPFYVYCYDFHLNLFPQRPSETFELIFRKAGYKDTIITYSAKALPVKENVIQVRVGQVPMATVNAFEGRAGRTPPVDL